MAHDPAAKAAIFDLDGTLVDSAALHAESWRQLCGELGVEASDEIFRRTFGKANMDIIPELLGRPLGQEELLRHSDRKEALYRDLARAKLVLFPGARDLLAGLAAAGWRLAIGSSTPRSNLDCLVPVLGLADLIETTVGMEDVTRYKPFPDTFLEAARRLGAAPARSLVFEDAPAGIDAAVAAGMTAVAITTHHPAERLQGAVAAFEGVWQVTADDCERWLAA